MTQSAIVAKYESDSVHSIKSLLISIALILCMAKAARNASSFLRKKVVFVQDEPVRKRRTALVSSHDAPMKKRTIVIQHTELEFDKPVSQLRANLVFFVDTPINQRTLSPIPVVAKSPVDDLAYKSFCQEKREHVKNWKEERIKRQLFEMWHALDENGQKEWLDKADALDKLFGLTDASDVYKDTVTPKYPKTEICKLLTKHASARAYFNAEMTKFRKFYNDHQEPGKPQLPKDFTSSNLTQQQREQYTQLQTQLTIWVSSNDNNQTYTNKVLQAWKSSDNVFVRKSLRDAVCETMIYSTIPKTDNEQIWSKTAKEWEACYDAFEHAYDLFCQKVKNTDPQMRVTEHDVNEHLSRMWEVLDDKAANTTGYAYFRGCNRDSLEKTNPETSKADLDSKLTRLWMELSKKEREDWAESAGVMTQRTM